MALFNDSTKLFGVVRARRRLALTVFLTVFALGVAISLLLPTKYTSSMRILIRATPTDLRATPDRADSATIGQVSEEEVNSEVELLTSYDLLHEAVVRNHLDAAEGRLTNPQKRVDTATRKLGKEIEVTAVRKANIIEVQYSAKSPQLAASVLRTIEGGYLESHLRAQSTPGGYRFFQGEMEYYKNALQDKQNSFARFSSTEDAANLDQQLTLLTKTISDQEAELQDSRAQVAQFQTEIGKSTNLTHDLSARIATTQRSVPNLSAIDHLTTLLTDLEDRRSQEASKFLEGDPVLKETDNEIATVKSELDHTRSSQAFEQSTDVNPISQSLQGGMASRSVQLAGLQAKVKVLEDQIGTNRSRVNHLTDVSGQYRLLSSDVQNAQDDYSNYVQRQEEARVAESLDKDKISNVVVAQQPTESVLPVPSHRLLVLALSFFVAVFASLASCLFAEASAPVGVLQRA